MLVTFYVHWYIKYTKTLNKSSRYIYTFTYVYEEILTNFQRFYGIPAASTVRRKYISVPYICSLLHMKL